jgi:hypothetical protein
MVIAADYFTMTPVIMLEEPAMWQPVSGIPG